MSSETMADTQGIDVHPLAPSHKADLGAPDQNESQNFFDRPTVRLGDPEAVYGTGDVTPETLPRPDTNLGKTSIETTAKKVTNTGIGRQLTVAALLARNGKSVEERRASHHHVPKNTKASLLDRLIYHSRYATTESRERVRQTQRDNNERWLQYPYVNHDLTPRDRVTKAVNRALHVGSLAMHYLIGDKEVNRGRHRLETQRYSNRVRTIGAIAAVTALVAGGEVAIAEANMTGSPFSFGLASDHAASTGRAIHTTITGPAAEATSARSHRSSSVQPTHSLRSTNTTPTEVVSVSAERYINVTPWTPEHTQTSTLYGIAKTVLKTKGQAATPKAINAEVVTISDQNNLKNATIYPGQRLIVH